ncbi:MAG: VOC family protein [bacterium]
MKTPYLEHANITVTDIDAAIRFLKVAFPDFQVRHRGPATAENAEWAHFGDDTWYIAIQGPTPGVDAEDHRNTYNHVGINHLGWVVESVDEIDGRLRAGGYTEGMSERSNPFRKRVYWYDSAGFEWEFVEYLSEKVEERNGY